MAGAKDVFVGQSKRRARDIIGGLAGELSTAELVKARAAYTQYAADVQSEGKDPEEFQSWVRSTWKKK